MTDTISPITEPHLTPMFATGSHPVASNTQPHPSPIFDTGPHPGPLLPLGAELVDDIGPVSTAEPEPEPEPAIEGEAGVAVVPEREFEDQSELAVDPEPLEPQVYSQAFSELENVDTDTFLRTVNGHLGPVAVPAQPVLVPGSYLFLKRWKFALITAGVWLFAAAAGLGFYYWWYTSLDKTLPVFGLLLYLAVCAVAGILVTMVPNRPQATALAFALMAAPMASTAAAAVLHGAYYFEWIARPVIG